MIKVKELIKWLNTLESNDLVWIDEGGLILETKNDNYIEVGGKIEVFEENENPKDFWSSERN